MTEKSGNPFGAVFKPDAAPSEVVAFNQRATEMMRNLPGLWDIGIAKARAGGFMPQAPRSPRSFDRKLGNVDVHVVPAESPQGIYLHIHGGALLLGSAAGQDPMLEGIAREVGVTCVSVEYRLAPEHTYPAAWDDCEAVAWWLARHAEAEFGTDALLIGGESAGAMLAVSTLLRLRDQHHYSGFRGAALNFGLYDNGLTPSARAAVRGIIRTRDVVRNTAAYCPDASVVQSPDVSPLYADLRQLPPALFTVGTQDGFLDDSMFMYCRWLSAGNRAEIAVWPGADHAFIETPHPSAAPALERMQTFLRDCLT